MTRQEEIREGMRKIINFCGNEPDICVGELEMFLAKMGVVIDIGDRWDASCMCYCKAVEPLIMK